MFGVIYQSWSSILDQALSDYPKSLQEEVWLFSLLVVDLTETHALGGKLLLLALACRSGKAIHSWSIIHLCIERKQACIVSYCRSPKVVKPRRTQILLVAWLASESRDNRFTQSQSIKKSNVWCEVDFPSYWYTYSDVIVDHDDQELVHAAAEASAPSSEQINKWMDFEIDQQTISQPLTGQSLL